MAIPFVTITGSLVTPDGDTPVKGTIRCRLSQPGTALDGPSAVRVIPFATGSVTDGVVSLSLVPNDAITPSGTFYQASFSVTLDTGRTLAWTENWQLASSPSTIDIGAVPRIDEVTGTVSDAAALRSEIIQGDQQSNAYTDAQITALSAAGGPGATEVSLSSATSAGSTTGRTLRDRFADVVNVRDFGALGDGTTNDTAAVQAAVDAAVAAGGGTVFFPPGTYMVTSVNVQEGIRLLGTAGSIIKRPASQPNGTRTFTTQNRKWNNALDSVPLVFENLILDGNRANQGAYNAYQLEQSHLVFLQGNSANAGRLRVIVKGCTLKEGVADGVSVYNNVDLTISDCFFDNLFRGGLVVTGGWSKVRGTNLRMMGDVEPTGLDFEVDGPGYGGSLRVDVELSNVDCAGDFDFAVKDGSVVFLSEIQSHAAPFNFYALDSTVRVQDSRFTVGVFSGSANRIVNPTDVKFTNVEFVVSEAGEPGDQTYAAAHVYWNVSSSTTGQRLEFDNCVFRTDSTIEAGDTVYGIYTEPDMYENDNRLIVRGGEFRAGLDIGIDLHQGGNLYLFNPMFDSATAVRFAPGGAYYSKVFVDGMTLGPGVTTYMNIYSHIANQTLRHVNTVLDESKNVLATTLGITNNVYEGGRTILSATDPASATNKGGLKGDVWRLKAPVAGSPSAWDCTVTHLTAATWVPRPARGAAQSDSVAADVATLKTDFNSLLAKLRAAGIIA
jgi:hypothetical protein